MKTSSRSMWVCVVGLFALMACAWTAMFFFAGKAQVESVPLVSDVRAGPPGPPSHSTKPGTQTDGSAGPALPRTEVR